MTEAEMNQKIERIRGRYAVIAAVITTLGVIVAAVIGYYAAIGSTNRVESSNVTPQTDGGVVNPSSELTDFPTSLGGQSGQVVEQSGLESVLLSSFLDSGSDFESYDEQVDYRGESHENCISVSDNYSSYSRYDSGRWRFGNTNTLPDAGAHYYSDCTFDLDWKYKKFSGIFFLGLV